jgi:hypothetical protein
MEMARYLAMLFVSSFCVAVASAELTFDLVAVDNTSVAPGDDTLVTDFNDGSYFTFDLLVVNLYDDDWLGGTVYATLSGPATFFQHPEGTNTPPDQSLIDAYPAVEFDSYFSGAPGEEPGFAEGPFNEPMSIWAGWYGVEFAHLDSYPIARYTVQWTGDAPATLTVDGTSASHKCERAFPVGPFTVTIPEPDTLALLALGAFGALRRR